MELPKYDFWPPENISSEICINTGFTHIPNTNRKVYEMEEFYMNNENSTSEQEEPSSIEFSLQLELIASIIGIISQALGILAILEAIEESKKAFEIEKQDQKEYNEQFKSLQLQINQLTAELTELKSTIN